MKVFRKRSMCCAGFRLLLRRSSLNHAFFFGVTGKWVETGHCGLWTERKRLGPLSERDILTQLYGPQGRLIKKEQQLEFNGASHETKNTYITRPPSAPRPLPRRFPPISLQTHGLQKIVDKRLDGNFRHWPKGVRGPSSNLLHRWHSL